RRRWTMDSRDRSAWWSSMGLMVERLHTPLDRGNRSVASAQVVPIDEIGLARPVHTRAAEGRLGRVGPRGCTARRTRDACAMHVFLPAPPWLAITGVAHGHPHERMVAWLG